MDYRCTWMLWTPFSISLFTKHHNVWRSKWGKLHNLHNHTSSTNSQSWCHAADHLHADDGHHHWSNRPSTWLLSSIIITTNKDDNNNTTSSSNQQQQQQVEKTRGKCRSTQKSCMWVYSIQWLSSTPSSLPGCRSAKMQEAWSWQDGLKDTLDVDKLLRRPEKRTSSRKMDDRFQVVSHWMFPSEYRVRSVFITQNQITYSHNGHICAY